MQLEIGRGAPVLKSLALPAGQPMVVSRSNPEMKRAIRAIIGGAVLLAGLSMLVLPGPALIFIPLGLGILATDFAWARAAMKKVRKLIRRPTKPEVNPR